jgi:hypothetical protein
MREPKSLEAAGARCIVVILRTSTPSRWSRHGVHTGFNHDFSMFVENCELDKRAIEALGSALGEFARPLLVTSGVALLGPGHIATEEDVPRLLVLQL